MEAAMGGDVIELLMRHPVTLRVDPPECSVQIGQRGFFGWTDGALQGGQMVRCARSPRTQNLLILLHLKALGPYLLDRSVVT